MNFLFKMLISIFLIIGISQKALALDAIGLFIEPGITYEDGDTKTTYPAPLSNSTGKVKGFGVAARAGLHFLETLFVGLDLRYAMTDFTDSASNYSAKAISTNLSAVVGMQMPIVGLRLWAGYVTSGELNPDRSGSLDVKYTSGTGSRVGAGFRIAMVSLNLEYQNLKYTNASIGDSGGVFPPGTSFNNVDLENKSWVGSVTFPIEF